VRKRLFIIGVDLPLLLGIHQLAVGLVVPPHVTRVLVDTLVPGWMWQTMQVLTGICCTK
jgi:hypothetical protein